MKKIILITTALLVFQLLSFSQEPEVDFRKFPYLIYPGNPAQMTVLWQTEEYIVNPPYYEYDIECTISWGEDTNYGTGTETFYESNGEDYYQYLYTIEGLTPETIYYYKVIINNLTLQQTAEKSSYFVSAPETETNEVTFFAYGDTRNGASNMNLNHTQILNIVSAFPNSLLIHSGDWVGVDSESQWTSSCFVDYQESINLKTMLPIMGVFGNHELLGQGGDVYKKYWPYDYYVTNEPPPPVEQKFYSFDYGPVHFTMAFLYGENATLSNTQKTWLQTDLTSDKPWKVLVFHCPIFDFSTHHEPNINEQQYIQNLCETNNVQIVINGHNHYYSHWMENNVHHMVLGGGGTSLYSINPGQGDITELWIHHFVKISVDEERMYMEVIDKYGVAQDNFYIPQNYKVCNGENIVWDDGVYYADEIKVCEGSTLTIKGNVKFSEYGKVIIEQGGELILDGGVLTNIFEDEFWKGIEVWGNPSSPYPYDQGMLTIKNGAIIENAEIAIRNHHYDGELVPPDNRQGGITKAYNSSFINNEKTFDLRSYGYNSSNYIKDCEFIYDENYFGTTNPGYFMEIRYMKGVNIISCDFINNTGENYKGKGIYSHYSRVNIKGKCISAVQPCTEWENSTFVNLSYGIYAIDYLDGKYIDIRNNTFDHCHRGVYISGMDGARVTSNEFILPVAGQKYECGLYLNNSTGYHIEENTFEGPSPTELGGIGLYINHSGESWNQVYNNTFENLKQGTVAYGTNRNVTGSDGLCIECNDYENNENDIVVNGKPKMGHGIAYNQGHQGPHDTLPAGNTFTLNFPDLKYNYYNADGMGFIDYVYHGENWTTELVDPIEYYSPQTMHKGPNPLAEYDKEAACPSKLDDNSGHIEDDREGIAESDTEIGAKEAQLVALVDGGDTEEMNFDVLLSVPPEAGELYQDLMNQSPFLSDTVMKTAIYKENVLPNVMIRDVLVANPQSAKDNDVLDAIDERFDPMPQWMKDQVMQGVNITGAKEAIESELAKWKQKRGEHFNNLYQYFRKDTINPVLSADSLEMLLNDDPYLASKYRLAFFYYNKQDYNNMNIVLNNIPYGFELTNTQQAVHLDYISLFSILEQMLGNELLVDSVQAVQLEMLAQNDDYFPGAYARDILFAAGFIDYEEPIILPEILKSSEAIDLPLNHSDIPEVLKVFPNPAKDYIIVDYNANGYFGEFLLSINNLEGKPVYAEVYTTDRDQKVINTKDWKSGIYLISLSVNGQIIKSIKVTIK